MENNKVTFQFISEPSDVNFGGKVHGGAVMKWIDQAAYTCARTWSGTYCVTVYVGGIRFIKPVSIGDIVKVDANGDSHGINEYSHRSRCLFKAYSGFRV